MANVNILKRQKKRKENEKEKEKVCWAETEIRSQPDDFMVVTANFTSYCIC